MARELKVHYCGGLWIGTRDRLVVRGFGQTACTTKADKNRSIRRPDVTCKRCIFFFDLALRTGGVGIKPGVTT